MTKGRLLAIQAALVGVAAVWGATFVVVQDAIALYPLYGFLGIRFTIATVAFVVLFPSAFRRFRAGTLGVGLFAGTFLTLGYIFQTWGLEATSASRAAFITGMFVVITPLLQALVLRRIPRPLTLAGVAVAVAGLWLLTGGDGGSWNVGDTRVLLCALAYSAHMIVLGGPGREHDARALTLVQLATAAVACTAVSVAVERPGLPTDGSVWVALVITGVLASAVAFAVQTYAQRFLSPTKTALILVTEPAFGGIFGYLAGETLGIGGLTGAVLILGGMILSELLGGDSAVADQVSIEPTLEGPAVPLIDDPGSPRPPRTPS